MNQKNFELIDLISRCRRHNDFELQEREKLLIELAAALEPFPGFLGMESIHAIELEPDMRFPDRGCLVVTDQGLIKELSLDLIPGPTVLGGVDSKETFREVDIEGQEKDFYLGMAIQILMNLVKEKSGFD
tara:strand:- start:244 stop:633 length:390 start_codon:yes stop_codon:yes gene_type:complete